MLFPYVKLGIIFSKKLNSVFYVMSCAVEIAICTKKLVKLTQVDKMFSFLELDQKKLVKKDTGRTS